MKGKDELRWGIVLGIFCLLGYFFTWENFSKYQEKKKEIEKQNTIKKLKDERKKELEGQKRILEKKKELSPKKKEEEIFPFHHILEFEMVMMHGLQRNHLKLLSVSRIIFDGNFVKIPVEFEGNWRSVFPFLRGMEENAKTIVLSHEYLKVEAWKADSVKVQCTFMIQVEEDDILELDLFLFEKGLKRKSYIKLGEKYVYF